MSNVTNQGITQSVQIQRGRISHQDKTADVGTVVKVNKGGEHGAWGAAGKNGADDIQFRTDAGDVYIASGSAFEKLDLHVGASVTLGGVKGRITALDNETNGKGEVLATRIGSMALFGLQAGFCGFLIGLMVIAPFAGILGMVIPAAVGVAAGVGMGWFGVNPKPNLDLLKLHGTEVE